MRAHVIKNGKVDNTISIERLDMLPGVQLLDASLGGKIGDLWDGETFTTPPKTPEQIAAEEAEAARQAAAIAAKEELALDQISKKSYAEIETYIRGIMAGLPTPTVDLIVKMGKLIKAVVDR